MMAVVLQMSLTFRRWLFYGLLSFNADADDDAAAGWWFLILFIRTNHYSCHVMTVVPRIWQSVSHYLRILWCWDININVQQLQQASLARTTNFLLLLKNLLKMQHNIEIKSMRKKHFWLDCFWSSGKEKISGKRNRLILKHKGICIWFEETNKGDSCIPIYRWKCYRVNNRLNILSTLSV